MRDPVPSIVRLRTVESKDRELLYSWANEAEVRSMSFSPAEIDWEEHKKWFETKLKSKETIIYVAENEDGAVGQIRFDFLNPFEAEVDIHIKAGLRGKGLGTQIIRQGTEKVFLETKAKAIWALVKSQNVKSLRAFEKSGFKRVREGFHNGHKCVWLILNRRKFSD